MNKYKQGIIKKLNEAGLMDIELKFWCVISGSWYDSNWMRYTEYMKYICKDYKDWYDVYRDDYSWVWNTRYDYDMPFDNPLPADDYEILWQYNLGTILRWFQINDYHVANNPQDHKIIICDWMLDTRQLELDLTKPPMEYSEEQDKEILAFMDKLWN